MVGGDDGVDAPVSSLPPAPQAAPAPAPAPTPTPVVAPTKTTAPANPAPPSAPASAPTPVPVSAAPARTPQESSSASAETASAPIAVSGDEETQKLLQRAERFGTAPPPAVLKKIEEEKKAARAARFGIEPKAAAEPAQVSKKGGNKLAAPAVPIPDEVLQRRIARFGVVSSAAKAVVSSHEAEEQATKLAERRKRFGDVKDGNVEGGNKKQKIEAAPLDPELAAKLEARAKRFGMSS